MKTKLKISELNVHSFTTSYIKGGGGEEGTSLSSSITSDGQTYGSCYGTCFPGQQTC